MSRPVATGVVAEPLPEVVDAVRHLAVELQLGLDEAVSSAVSSTFTSLAGSRYRRTRIIVEFETIQPERTRVTIAVPSSSMLQRRRGRRLANAVLDGVSALRPLSWNE